MTNTQAGAVFGDRYEITRKIARGGMADVFLARDQLLDRPVALKVLFAELSVDPSFVERFRREAQNAAKLSHPNIVSVYDWGEENSTYFIVMEYVDGRSLSSMLREGGPLPPQRAAQIGSEVASALSFAHRNGVVHRDVKPGNVLIDSRGSVKVTDFGIARARNTTENLTQTGAVMGTATYFSPEQAQGLSVDPRSDVYSLGVVLYEMVAGKPPFQGDNPVTIAYKHVREDPLPLRQVDPSIPVDFESITAQSMTKSPANRYATAEELRNDLERFRRSQPVHATAIAPSMHRPHHQQMYADSTRTIPSVPPSERATPPSPPPPPKGKGIMVPLLVFVSLLAALAIAAIVVLSGGFGSGKQLEVPNVVFLAKADAETKIKAANLKAEFTEKYDQASEGTVIAQNPAAPTTVTEGSTVTLSVSKGPPPTAVPDVTGQTVEAARRSLSGAGFSVTTTETTSETVEKGKVISQNPTGDSTLPKGGKVTLTVSSGPPQVQVPDLEGFTVKTAKQTLSDKGLRAGVDAGVSDSELVIDTDPGGGESVPKGTLITIITAQETTTTTTDRFEDELEP